MGSIVSLSINPKRRNMAHVFPYLLLVVEKNSHVERQKRSSVCGQHHAAVAGVGCARRSNEPEGGSEIERSAPRHRQRVHGVGCEIIHRCVHVSALSAGKQLVDDGWGIDRSVQRLKNIRQGRL